MAEAALGHRAGPRAVVGGLPGAGGDRPGGPDRRRGAARDAFAAAERLAARARPAAGPGLRAARARHRRPAAWTARPAGWSGPGRWPWTPALLGLAATLDVQIAAGLLHRDVDRALAYAARSAELARRLRADRLWATAVYFQAIAHAHRRETEEVERCVQEALALAPDDLDVNAGDLGRGPGARGAAGRRPGPAGAVPRPGDRLPAAQPEHHPGAGPRAVGAGPHAGRPGRHARPARRPARRR